MVNQRSLTLILTTALVVAASLWHARIQHLDVIAILGALLTGLPFLVGVWMFSSQGSERSCWVTAVVSSSILAFMAGDAYPGISGMHEVIWLTMATPIGPLVGLLMGDDPLASDAPTQPEISNAINADELR